MMSSKLQASRRCRTQERSVFLGATLSRSLHESRESEAVGYTKPSGLKNPRFSKSGSSQSVFTCGIKAAASVEVPVDPIASSA
jgi:hypothetical protein